MPTHPPCCQTLQPSHCMNHPVVSSAKAAGLASLFEIPLLASLMVTGSPGYSEFPQMHLVTSSSPSSSGSSSIACVFSSLTASWLLLVLRAWCLGVPSGSSDDCDRAVTELLCESEIWFERALRSAWPEETEDEEELVCCGTEGVGCVMRARDERRGDMVAMSVVKAVSAWQKECQS